MTLQQQIEALATSFAKDVLNALRGASMLELGSFSSAPRTRVTKGRVTRAPATRRGGRLARRSPEQIAAVVTQIAKLLKGKKEGMRAEAIEEALGLSRKELPQPLREALAKKVIRRKGQKRATTYFAR